MKSKITKEELEAIKKYKDEKQAMINQMFDENVESDIVYLLQKEDYSEYSRDYVKENIDLIKVIFTALVKNSKRKSGTLYKQTNLAEIDQWQRNSEVNHFLLTTFEQEEAQKKLSNNWSRGIMLQMELDEKIPFVEFNKKEILIAPFMKIMNMEEIEDENEMPKTYQATFEMQQLERLSEEEKAKLYEDILNHTEEVQKKLKACVELEKENGIHYENIRKLEQLLAKHHLAMEQENYEEDTTEAEKQSDLDEVARINLELTSLKESLAKSYNLRDENADFIVLWKKKMVAYLKNEFREIEEKYSVKKEEQAETKTPEKSDVSPKELPPEVASIKAEALENIAVVDTLLKNIKNLISKQQNHARIAESMDSNYKALNNAFEMKNFAEELDALLHSISNKIDTISPENTEELDKISKTNIQVSILLNYLNNAKAAVSKKITRFDEMSIIEENELKKEIAETIKNIRCEAELKKLNDDIDIIEDKSNFRKFIGRFTGRNKLDRTMLDQIQIRQTAIRKTFKRKMPISYNYSIHELIAEIEMFIKENQDDELVMEDVSALRKIKEVLKKNFVIIDSKVMAIIDQKTGKNLPLASRKISKKELIEIDTYRFLNRYGYDKSNDTEEPEYQDTMANEIKRIVDYVKTSGVL